MNDNTDNEREELETKFLDSLDDKLKAIINIANEVNRLNIQQKFNNNDFSISCTFNLFRSNFDNNIESWIYIFTLNTVNNKVTRFDVEASDSIDILKDKYNAFVIHCNECGYSTRTWEQIQSNTDFIQYIR